MRRGIAMFAAWGIVGFAAFVQPRLQAQAPSAQSTETGPPHLRIQTQLFVGTADSLNDAASSPPVAQTLSLFFDGRAYDYIEPVDPDGRANSDGPIEVTLFEPDARQFQIYHRPQQLATRIPFELIERELDRRESESRRRLRQLIERSQDETSELVAFGQFLLDPRFIEIYDSQSGVLTLHSPSLRYRVRTVPLETAPPVRLAGGVAHSGITADQTLTALREYWDWHARLNHLLNPGSLPPGPRLAVNDALYRRELLPTEVELTVNVGRTWQVRSTHATSWELHSADRERINNTHRQLQAARLVPWADFVKRTAASSHAGE